MRQTTSMSEVPQSLRNLDRLEDRIRQQRGIDKRPALVVEGPTDLEVLRRHLPGVQIFPADGRKTALRTVSQLLAWGISDVIAVIDRDFEKEEELDQLALVVHPYEARDLEGMLIGLGVLDLIFEHQGSRDKLKAVGGSSTLIQRLMTVVEPVSALRRENSHQNLALSFSELDLAHKVDNRTLELDLAGFCTALVSVSDTTVGPHDLVELAKRPPVDSYGPRGKDLAALAGVALRSIAGTLPLQATREAIITAQLHSSSGLALSSSSWLAQLKAKLGPAGGDMSGGVTA